MAFFPVIAEIADTSMGIIRELEDGKKLPSTAMLERIPWAFTKDPRAPFKKGIMATCSQAASSWVAMLLAVVEGGRD